MQLGNRPTVYELPSYSLTSDLLGYIRCGLQYRYTRLGHLPSVNGFLCRRETIYHHKDAVYVTTR